MKINGVNFAPVLERAARLYASETNADTPGAHSVCQLWFAQNRERIEGWTIEPSVRDPRGLAFRSLLNHLGLFDHAPGVNPGAMYVIAAGNGWDEEPSRRRVNVDVSPYAADYWSIDDDTTADDLEPLFAFWKRASNGMGSAA